MKVISVPVAVHTDSFKNQLDLFWYHHKKIYGANAYDMAHAIILKRNSILDDKIENIQWDLDIPHTMCDAYFDYNEEYKDLPLIQTNIQFGLMQIINKFYDDDVVEILDCDMFHMKERPMLTVKDDEVYVATEYENWHLKSKSDNKHIIEMYLHNDGSDYNGGFVPIICNIRTLKKIMYEWIAVNVDIVKRNYSDKIIWWSSMYALSAACQKANVNMIEYNKCYIHKLNELTDDKYICHYSVDDEYINKKDAKKMVSIRTYHICKTSKNKYANLYAEWLRTKINFSKKIIHF
jgi:hypothetical protein